MGRRGRRGGRGGMGGMFGGGMVKKLLFGAVAGYAAARFAPQLGQMGALGAGFLAGGPAGAAGAFLGPRFINGGGSAGSGANPV